MSTTTTAYGWTIPQSTDLVRNGATAIATLGQNIDDFISGSAASGKLFNITTDSTSAAQTTTSTTYVQKTDCQLTFTTGKSGLFVVILSANVEAGLAGNTASVSFDISGGVTQAASDSYGVLNANANRIKADAVAFFDGTANTSTTVTMNMKTTSGSSTATCNYARLTVVTFG